MIRNRLTRPGITLVEMMVAMALSLGIMLILTESFKMALDFVRGANSTGELIYQLNGAGNVLTRDLTEEHFLPEDDKPGRGVKLSNQRLDWYNPVPALNGWTPPKGGFFRIVAPSPGVELSDAYGFNINNPAMNHSLHFTTVLKGGNDQNLFTVLGGSVNYSSRAAEIAYFLNQTGWTTPNPSDPKRQPLFNLVRRQRLLALTADEQANLMSGGITTAVPSPGEVVSLLGANINTMASVRGSRLTPLAQLAGPTPGPASIRYGEDILLSNVLSFEIQADWTPHPTQPGSTQPPAPFSAGNTDSPYSPLTQGAGVFDTAAPTQFVRIKSLQILIRVYDPRMKQTRQNTWKIAM